MNQSLTPFPFPSSTLCNGSNRVLHAPVAALSLMLLFLGCSGKLLAIDYVFTGTGNWSTGTWSPSYPGTHITAFNTITIQGNCTVDVEITNTYFLTIDAGASLTVSGGNLTTYSFWNNGSLVVNNGRTLFLVPDGDFTNNGTSAFISGNLTISTGGNFTQNGASASISGTLTNNGFVTVNAGKTLSINSGGIYNHNGTLTPNGSFVNDGTVTIYSTKTLTVNETWFSSNGNITVNNGGTLVVNGSIPIPGTLANDGTVTVNATKTLTIASGGAFTHNGTSATISGTLTNDGTVTVNATKTLTIASGGTFTHNGTSATISGTLTNNGTVTVNTGKTVTINSDGTYNHKGTLIPNGALVNDGAVAISNLGTLTVSDTWFTSNGSITVNIGGTLVVDGSIPIKVTKSLINNGTVTVNAGKTLTINGGSFTHNGTSASISGTLTNDGTITVNASKTLTITSDGTFMHNGNSASISGTLANDGTITVNASKTLTIASGGTFTHNGTSATISGTLTNNGTIAVNADKTLTIASGGTFTHNGTSATISGTLTNDGTASVSASRTLTIASGATFTHNGTSTTISGTLTNDGTVSVNAGKTLDINTGGAFTHNGTNATISGTLTNNGTITVNAGKTLTQATGGAISNNGAINGAGSINTASGAFSNPLSGTLSPGNSPGCLSFGNGLSNSGTLVIEVDGILSCTTYDRINVTGTATLGGTLNVSINYTPSNGDVITFVNATSISGSFASINPPLPAGWALAYNSPSAGKVSLQFTVLPVELVDFKAALLTDNSVLLTWQTASEQDNEGFEVERSANGQQWETLGFVTGQGTTLEAQSYDYTDERPLPGINYYRLKQVDFNGGFEYTDIRSVNMEGRSNGVLVYPNPVQGGELNINFAIIPESDFTLRLFDAGGRLLFQEVLTNQFNQTGYGNLSAGIYFLEISNRKQAWRERLVVVR